MEPTHDELMALWNLCKGFVDEHKPSCAESIYQVDDISLSCQDFVVEICDCVGYFNYGNEEEEKMRHLYDEREKGGTLTIPDGYYVYREDINTNIYVTKTRNAIIVEHLDQRLILNDAASYNSIDSTTKFQIKLEYNLYGKLCYQTIEPKLKPER